MNPLDQLRLAIQMLGTGTPQSSEAMQREMAADATLNQQGSLMGGQRQQQQLGERGPAMATIQQLTNALNPINWMGGTPGGSGAVLAPTANPQLQELLAALTQRAPRLMQQVQAMPETIFTYLTNQMRVPRTLGTFQRSRTLPRAEIQLRSGRPTAEQVNSLAHELQHGITEFGQNIGIEQPRRAMETAQQLTAMMPPEQRELLARYIPQSAGARRGIYSGTPEEVLKTFRGDTTRGMIPLLNDLVSPREAYSEARSYLTEALLNPRGSDPALEAVANALGFGIK